MVSNHTNNSATTLGNENVQNEKKSCRKNPDRIVSEREILYYRSRKLGTNRYLQQKIYKKNFFFIKQQMF